MQVGHFSSILRTRNIVVRWLVMSNANEKPASNVQAFHLVDLKILACDWTTKIKAQLSLDEGQIRSLISSADFSTILRIRKIVVRWRCSWDLVLTKVQQNYQVFKILSVKTSILCDIFCAYFFFFKWKSLLLLN